MMSPYVLVLYYSVHGSTEVLAKHIARGVESVEGIEARLRTVPKVSTSWDYKESEIPESGDLYCTEQDLIDCAGLIYGSPTRFGNMASAMKYFWDGTANQWLNGQLINKPAGVFTSTSSMHGGQESTLLTMMLPLLHHGMLVAGIPYNESALHHTKSGGTPYGSSKLSPSGESEHPPKLTDHEKSLAIAQGKRIATLAQQLTR